MNVVDDYTRECLAIDVAFWFGSHDVIRCFEAIADDRNFPQAIRFDHGAPSSQVGLCCNGPRPGRSICSSFNLASRLRTPRSSRSTAASATNCSLPTRFSISRRSSTGRVLETGLQRDPPAFFARLSNPEGVRPNLFNHPTLTVMTCAKATSRQGGTLVG